MTPREAVGIYLVGRESAHVLAAVHRAAFVGAAIEPWSPSAIDLLLRVPGSVALLARFGVSDQAVGLGLARVIADVGEVLTLGVVAHARHRGVGSSLLTGLLAAVTAIGAHRVFLEVAVCNLAALDLYRRHGFATVCRQPGYYGNRKGRVSDAIVLNRSLRSET
ncbi:MAG: GNAT family N-acetyltransferase [Alphaproteobacteria bacterium]